MEEPTGRDLDAWIEQHIMGRVYCKGFSLVRGCSHSPGRCYPGRPGRFSSELQMAYEMEEAIHAKGNAAWVAYERQLCASALDSVDPARNFGYRYCHATAEERARAAYRALSGG